MFELFLLFQLFAAYNCLNPCVDYQLMYADGLRSSDFESSLSAVSICDAYLDEETWYRFDQDAGNRLVEGPIEPWFCGTQAPIWINGSHPKDTTEVIVEACATFSAENICGWNGAVRIRLCNDSESEYFVYLLAVPPGCPLAYCIDAASRKQCIAPLVWLQEEFKCGEIIPETIAPNTTVPLTTPTTSTTTSRPSTERQSSTTTTRSPSTEPENSDWSRWGPWSVCSKPCDYGYQSRKRTCGQLPCEGSANDYRLCNEYNCQKIPEEKNRGVVFVLQDIYNIEDTMLTVAMNQQRIHEILRSSINSMCSQNVPWCCGSQYNGIYTVNQEFVTADDIYPSQGRLVPRPDNTLYYQVIAVVNEDIDSAVCKGGTERRQLEVKPNFVSVDVMMMACVETTDSILQKTGLNVKACIYPSTFDEYNADNIDCIVNFATCPTLTCVVPIVVSIIVVVAVAIGGLCLAKEGCKPRRTKPETYAPPRYEVPHLETQIGPPAYEEISSVGLSLQRNTYLEPVALNVNHSANSTISDPGPTDIQKIDLVVDSSA